MSEETVLRYISILRYAIAAEESGELSAEATADKLEAGSGIPPMEAYAAISRLEEAGHLEVMDLKIEATSNPKDPSVTLGYEPRIRVTETGLEYFRRFSK